MGRERERGGGRRGASRLILPIIQTISISKLSHPPSSTQTRLLPLTFPSSHPPATHRHSPQDPFRRMEPCGQLGRWRRASKSMSEKRSHRPLMKTSKCPCLAWACSSVSSRFMDRDSSSCRLAASLSPPVLFTVPARAARG